MDLIQDLACYAFVFARLAIYPKRGLARSQDPPHNMELMAQWRARSLLQVVHISPEFAEYWATEVVDLILVALYLILAKLALARIDT